MSNPYKEGEFLDPGRLAMNRHQRAEDMFIIGNDEEYVPTSLIVVQRYILDWRERGRACDGIKKGLICVGNGENISSRSGQIRGHRE